MSRVDIRDVRLEIVRPGKPHNQLLSPLTPYTALCGEGSPVTFHIEFEHQQLLTRLERLRYVTRSGTTVTAVPPMMREAELTELGNEVARIFSAIDTLSPELARAQQASRAPGEADTLVHLRLVVSGSELALIPFELMIAPLAYPGEGLEFCLQASLPTVVTREIRRGRQVPISWNRSSTTQPKVLFVYAQPEGMVVPAQQHLRALRQSLEPWIRHLPEKERGGDARENARRRLPFVKKRLHVLANATIKDIYRACARERFTHVHILAHGATYEYAGNTRYGVALCDSQTPGKKEVISGKRLAKALQAEDAGGCGRSHPLVVTLATCDSANQTSVLVPGGSIAHDLHVEGVPWVFASQFPLTVDGSVRMTSTLYPRLFRGDDPRQVLFEIRRQLYQTARVDHDWASVVAYAAVPSDFTTQVSKFRSRQIKAAIDVCLDHADSLVANGGGRDRPRGDELIAAVKKLIAEVEQWLRIWRCSEPTGNSADDKVCRAEIRGMHGSAYKRVALLLTDLHADAETIQRYYGKSLEEYGSAVRDAGATNMEFYWTATQSLSLQAVKDRGPNRRLYDTARILAERDADESANDVLKAWACGTLAELDLLSLYHAPPSNVSVADLQTSVRKHCAEIRRLTGARSFQVGSTLRQFQRYRNYWPDPQRDPIVDAAIEALRSGDDRFDYPSDDD